MTIERKTNAYGRLSMENEHWKMLKGQSRRLPRQSHQTVASSVCRSGAIFDDAYRMHHDAPT
jgi:hypothetical protein